MEISDAAGSLRGKPNFLLTSIVRIKCKSTFNTGMTEEELNNMLKISVGKKR